MNFLKTQKLVVCTHQIYAIGYCCPITGVSQAFAGGPLSETIGDKLVHAGVRLYSCYALTEVGSPTLILDEHESADWAWHRINENWTHRWVPQGDSSYELQFLVSATQSLIEWRD